MNLRSLLPACLLLWAAGACAQDTLIVVYGTVRDHVTREPVPQALVVAFDERDAGHRITKLTNALGRYQVDITEERVYRLAYTAQGYYPKSVVIAATGPSPEEWEGGYGMNIDIVLLPEVEGLDMSFGGEPFGMARFDRESGNFQWDLAYTEGMKERVAGQMKEYRSRLGLPEEPPR